MKILEFTLCFRSIHPYSPYDHSGCHLSSWITLPFASFQRPPPKKSPAIFTYLPVGSSPELTLCFSPCLCHNGSSIFLLFQHLLVGGVEISERNQDGINNKHATASIPRRCGGILQSWHFKNQVYTSCYLEDFLIMFVWKCIFHNQLQVAASSPGASASLLASAWSPIFVERTESTEPLRLDIQKGESGRVIRLQSCNNLYNIKILYIICSVDDVI